MSIEYRLSHQEGLDLVCFIDTVNGKPVEEWLASHECRKQEEWTCRMAKGEGPQRGWWVCSACGGASDAIIKGGRGPNFCGVCGAKVIDE